MDPFELTEDAIFDIDAIWLYVLQKEGVVTADRIVTELFKGFYKLASSPNSEIGAPISRAGRFYSIKCSLTSSSIGLRASLSRFSGYYMVSAMYRAF